MTPTTTKAKPAGIKWIHVGECRYETEVNGAKFLLQKFSRSGKWFLYIELPESQRKDGLRWDVVKPHRYVFDFGGTLAKAKHNAALLLRFGHNGDSELWKD